MVFCLSRCFSFFPSLPLFQLFERFFSILVLLLVLLACALGVTMLNANSLTGIGI